MKYASFLLVLLFSSFAAAAPNGRDLPDRELPLRNWLPALWEPAPVQDQAGEGAVAVAALPSAASHFIAVTPCRVVDTRLPDGAHGGPILTGGVARSFEIPSAPCSGIPVAAAYSINLSVTASAPGASQFLTAYPAGTTRPLIATMVFNGGQTLSNAAIVPADAAGAIEIYASANTHVIVDINGYVKEGVVTSVTPGAGLTGGGTGDVAVGIAGGGIGATQLGASSVTTGALADAAVTGQKIANGEVVRDVNGIADSITIQGAGGASVSSGGSTITIDTAAVVPAGTIILGQAGDTTLIGSGFEELGPSLQHVWLPTSTSGAASGRLQHTAVWTGTKMIVWAGETAVGPHQNGGLYDPAADSWSATTTVGAPSARYEHSAVWTGTEMIVWGGGDDLDTGGRYNPVADTWTAMTVTNAPSGRRNHTAIWTGLLMVVWCGQDDAGAVSGGGRYDPALDVWGPVSTTSSPDLRFGHTAVWNGTHMIVWGGYAVGSPTQSGGRYDPEANTWTATSNTGAPGGRFHHAAVWTGTEMIVWGGDDDAGGPTTLGSHLNTGGRYDPVSDSWTATSTVNAPPARSRHTGVWTGARFIVWGGQANDNVNTGGEYDPSENRWTLLPVTGAPSPRRWHTAVWTGKEMIVWGGWDNSTPLNSGARWGALSVYRKN